jgi:hypothetical protein
MEASHPFTLTLDWLAFTLPESSVGEVVGTIGGNWSSCIGGFLGYPTSWIMDDGLPGSGRLGTGAPRKPHEVHVSLPAGIVSAWSLDKVQAVLDWVFDRKGRLTRIDSALDDRQPFVSVKQIKHAVDAGQSITRAKKILVTKETNSKTGADEGETLYIGCRSSQTMLRVYDKRLEMQQKGRDNWKEYGVRWELQLKKHRAHACAEALRGLSEEKWRQYLIGVLRSCINFRETTRDAPRWERSRAPLLSWWTQLTEDFERCQLMVERREEWGLDHIKRYLKPHMSNLATLVISPGGWGWLDDQIKAGSRRDLWLNPSQGCREAAPHKYG